LNGAIKRTNHCKTTEIDLRPGAELNLENSIGSARCFSLYEAKSSGDAFLLLIL
jgi:hypothetical protein